MSDLVVIIAAKVHLETMIFGYTFKQLYQFFFNLQVKAQMSHFSRISVAANSIQDTGKRQSFIMLELYAIFINLIICELITRITCCLRRF